MEWHEFEDLVDRKIREHELRVALSSGLIGAIIAAGLFHAIWLNHSLCGCPT